ncbi:MAG: DUF4232 domain-containing protein [Acidobacteria bacterium]|nr:DUF4232 domain-containing protein [Acidobacteriota bacterium]
MTKLFVCICIGFSLSAIALAAGNPVSARTSRRVAVCTASQLSVRIDPDFGGDAAMGGQRAEQFLIKNISSRRCTVSGTPGAKLLDRRGRRMGGVIAPSSGGSLTLNAGGKATFEVGYHSCQFIAGATDRNPRRCRMSRTAQIRFRGMSHVFSVRDRLDAEDGFETVVEWQKK